MGCDKFTHEAFKLTDRYGYTRRGQSGETLWQVGEIVAPTGDGTRPCGPGVLHGYVLPEVAVLVNPIHADFGRDMRLFRVLSNQPWQTDGVKRWTAGRCMVAEELPVPAFSTEERVAWAIILAPHPSTREWAIRWLSGVDRTEEAA